MNEDFDHREPGSTNLFTKTLLILYTGLLAFTSGKVHATTPASAGALPLDEDFVSRLRRLKYKPQLVLKLNLANPLASKAMMHTSHRSHSSHSSHYSSSGGGHSSHTSHVHYTSLLRYQLNAHLTSQHRLNRHAVVPRVPVKALVQRDFTVLRYFHYHFQSLGAYA
jgi:hypothetical protein